MEEAALCEGMKRGGFKAWSKVYKFYKAAQSQSHRQIVLRALACAENVQTLFKYYYLLTIPHNNNNTNNTNNNNNDSLPKRSAAVSIIIFRVKNVPFAHCFSHLNPLQLEGASPVSAKNFKTVFENIATTPQGVRVLTDFLSHKLDAILALNDGHQLATFAYSVLASKVVTDDEIKTVIIILYHHIIMISTKNTVCFISVAKTKFFFFYYLFRNVVVMYLYNNKFRVPVRVDE